MLHKSRFLDGQRTKWKRNFYHIQSRNFRNRRNQTVSYKHCVNQQNKYIWIFFTQMIEQEFDRQSMQTNDLIQSSKGQIASQINSPVKESLNSSEKTKKWIPSSWREFQSHQQPFYEDQVELDKQLNLISKQPGIVTTDEIEQLRQNLTAVEKGEAFFIHMGDCAELFSELDDQFLQRKLEQITATSRIFSQALQMPCIKIGRIGGQYAKPRTQEYETLEDGTIRFNYRGDNVNSHNDRKPNPLKLMQGYMHSTSTLKYIRENQKNIMMNTINLAQYISEKPYPDQHSSPQHKVDPELVANVSTGTSNEGNIYSSHEGLLLGYEESATKLTNTNKYYNLSTHLLWLGERTRQLDGGHVEYFSGISNPIAAKVGPSTNGATLKALVERLNPLNEEGKLIIICRMGAKSVEKVLPELIETKKKHGLNFIWSVDPMHGNTYTAASGIKTRKTQDILLEMTIFTSIIHQNGQRIGGIHLETSPIQVTECVGFGIEETDLHACYTSSCDPRLNISQTLFVCQQFVIFLTSLNSPNRSI